MTISDYPAGQVIATVPIGSGVDGAGYDAASGNAFASNADGTLTVIHQVTAAPDFPGAVQIVDLYHAPAPLGTGTQAISQ